MVNLFFYSESPFAKTADLVFKALGIPEYFEGESSNVASGVYYVCTVFGAEIKLEQNSYDYEDEFNYMLHVKEYNREGIKISSEIIEKIGEIVGQLIKYNLLVDIAVERNDKLVAF